MGGRATVQWPLQSIATETEVPVSPLSSVPPYRPVSPQSTEELSWSQASDRGEGGSTEGDSTEGDSTEEDIVPDYIIRYLRGETLGTPVQRTQSILSSRQAASPQHGVVNLVANSQSERHRSRVADLDEIHYSDDGPSSPALADSRAIDEAQRFLSEPNEKSSNGGRGLMRLATGWRAGIARNVLVTFLILIAGFICLVVAVSEASVSGWRPSIFEGSCSEAVAIEWGLHAVASILAVILVAGANYAFQVLSSPTRDEVMAAHHKRNWLDMGIPSFRNLRHIETSRMLLAMVALVVAFCSQIA